MINKRDTLKMVHYINACLIVSKLMVEDEGFGFTVVGHVWGLLANRVGLVRHDGVEGRRRR
jgi:hypothetical protein